MSGWQMSLFEQYFDDIFDRSNRCTLIVRGEISLIGGMNLYKVYVNGNIHITGSRFADLAPSNSIYTRIPAGTHEIVIREFDHRKTDRLESNKINLELHEGDEVLLWASLDRENLILSHEL